MGIPLAESFNGRTNDTHESQSSPNRVLVLSQNEAESGLTINAIYGEFLASAISVAQPADRMGIDREIQPQYFESSRVDNIKVSLLDARSLLRSLRIKEAEENLNLAAALFLRLQSPQNHIELHSEILSFQIELALLQTSTENATRGARLWARINPDRADLHPGLYSPTMVQNYQNAVELNRAKETGLVVLRPRTSNTTDPIEIFIDHQSVSFVDKRLILGVGPHMVSVRQLGRLTQNRLIEIRQNELLVLDPLLPIQNAGRARARLMSILRATWIAERIKTQPLDRSSTLSLFAQIAELTGTDLILWIDDSVVYVWTPSRSLQRVNQYDEGTGEFAVFSSSIVSDAVLAIAQTAPLPAAKTQTDRSKDGLADSGADTPIDEGRAAQASENEVEASMEDILIPTSLGAATLIAGGFVLMGSIVAVLFYWPNPSEPASPPRSVVVVCCGRGASQ